MSIWQRPATLEQLNQGSKETLVEHIGIRFTVLADDRIEAVMPVDTRTRQPFGLLHGGASVALAESLGSMAGWLCSLPGQNVVGIDINATHLRALYSGSVRGVCRALHLGGLNQVWQIEIYDPRDRLCCISRLTTAIIG